MDHRKLTSAGLFPFQMNCLLRPVAFLMAFSKVFHVLADGMGGMNFLREITYQYLRLIHKEISNDREEYFSDDTSLNTEDSY